MNDDESALHDFNLRTEALRTALGLTNLLAANKLLTGKVTDLDVAAAAKEFYTFLKGQA